MTRYRNLFYQFDKDNSGELSVKEFRKLLHEIDKTMKRSEVDSIIHYLDKDGTGFQCPNTSIFHLYLCLIGSGTITFREFMMFQSLQEHTIDAEESLRLAFYLADKNHDGFVSVNELKYVLLEDIYNGVFFWK